MIGLRFLRYAFLAAALLVSACTGQQDETPTEGQTQAPPQGVTAQEDIIVIDFYDRIFFDFDSAALRPDAVAAIDRNTEWLKANPDVNITTEGHTAASEGRAYPHGPEKYNLDLGCRRARAAREALIERGVPPERMGTVSYGQHRPAVLGDNEAAWSQNRRAVFVNMRPGPNPPTLNCGER